MFILGHIYRRRDLHDQFGGQRQGGISTPANHPIILLFTSESGELYGYQDGWDDEVYYYTGEGQHGDMEFIRGNRSIRDHALDGKDLHLFSYAKPAHVRYEGRMICIGSDYENGMDLDGKPRRLIVFDLVSASEFTCETVTDDPSLTLMTRDSLEDLRIRAQEVFGVIPNVSERKQVMQNLSNSVIRYVLNRANGICEGCGLAAPFKTDKGSPYLELHHLRRLSDGGPELPRWVVGVCPNCHRRAHSSEDARSYNLYLEEAAS